MSSVNRVILVGHLGRDPETRTFPSGDQVCNVSIATTEKWKDKQSGEAREATEWHRLQFNGRLAEIAAQYLVKGSQIYVEGSIRTRKYEKDGQDHYATDIRVDQMKMLHTPNRDGQGQGNGRQYGDSRDDRGNGGGQGGGNYDRGGQDNRGGGQSYQQGNGNQGGQRGSYSDQRGRGDGNAQGGQQQWRQGAQTGQGGGQPQRGNTSAPAQGRTNTGGGASGFDDMDDDIPF